MEIIFDDTPDNTFQGHTYPVITLDTTQNIKISQIYKNVKNIILQNTQNRIIIIQPTSENNNMHLYAALLGIEQSNDHILPACAIIKVKNHAETMKKHEPYMYLTTAATYALRLSQMNNKEMYRDIETLGYLGLDIQTNYQTNIITIRHPSNGRTYNFKSNGKASTIVLASLTKILSLMKIKPPLDITVQITKTGIDTPVDFMQLLNKLLWCCKLLFNPKNFE